MKTNECEKKWILVSRENRTGTRRALRRADTPVGWWVVWLGRGRWSVCAPTNSAFTNAHSTSLHRAPCEGRTPTLFLLHLRFTEGDYCTKLCFLVLRKLQSTESYRFVLGRSRKCAGHKTDPLSCRGVSLSFSLSGVLKHKKKGYPQGLIGVK